MGGAHAHRGEGADDEVEVGRLARALLLGLLLAALLGAAYGMVSLWPDGSKVDRVREGVSFAAPGVTFPTAVVTRVEPPCAEEGSVANTDDCGHLHVTVTSGASRGTDAAVDVAAPVLASGLGSGDEVQLLATPATGDQTPQFSYFGTERDQPLGILALVFAVVVVAVARLRGLLAMVGLAVGGVVLWRFTLPALLLGEPAWQIGLVTAGVILFVVLYTTHGLSMRTSAALAGTLAGVGITAAIAAYAVDSTHLTGVGDESGNILSGFVSGLDFPGLLTCAVIIIGLGVLNDVTITQASAVWELRAAGPDLSRPQLFARGMRIGRDHIASTIYTIVFAYAGAALTVLMTIQLYDRPLLDLLPTEEIGQEVVRALVSSIGLVLAVPITTAIAAITVPGRSHYAYHQHDLRAWQPVASLDRSEPPSA